MIREGKAGQAFLITPPCPEELHIWQVWYWVPSGYHHWKMMNWFPSGPEANALAEKIMNEMRTWVRVVEIDFTAKPDKEE